MRFWHFYRRAVLKDGIKREEIHKIMCGRLGCLEVIDFPDVLKLLRERYKALSVFLLI